MLRHGTLMYVHQFFITHSPLFPPRLPCYRPCSDRLFQLMGAKLCPQMIRRNHTGGKTQSIFPPLYCLIKYLVGELVKLDAKLLKERSPNNLNNIFILKTLKVRGPGSQSNLAPHCYSGTQVPSLVLLCCSLRHCPYVLG